MVTGLQYRVPVRADAVLSSVALMGWCGPAQGQRGRPGELMICVHGGFSDMREACGPSFGAKTISAETPRTSRGA